MGGCVGFTLREESGKEHRMCRWTNILPWACCNVGVANKDPEHIKAILKEWRKMVADYKKHGDSESSPSPMASIYVPHAGLNPVEYGLVVMDFKTNNLLNMQGYTLIDRFNTVHLRLDLTQDERGWHPADPGKEIGFRAFEMPDTDAYRFKQLFDAKKVASITVPVIRSKKRPYPRKTIEFKKDDYPKFEDVIAEYVTDKKKSNWHCSFAIDLSPMKVTNFESTAEGVSAYREAVLDLGFKLSKDEEEEWKKWAERFEDDES